MARSSSDDPVLPFAFHPLSNGGVRTAAALEQYRYPALTPDVKSKVLGLNAARLYGIDPR
jgi:hypothetical protein